MAEIINNEMAKMAAKAIFSENNGGKNG